ncbi:MAG: histidine phosphatase family protein [Chloroflexi bacterium]|nr:histidine phosphatase family protein [Chloroflexota bacterium]
MAKLYLVRHAETAWNQEGRVQGHTDTPLSEKGQLQAVALGQRLSRVQFHRAFSSDLSRCVQTAQAILAQRPVPLAPAPELREMSYGEWEAQSWRDVQARHPEQMARIYQRDPKFAPGGGESIMDLMERTRRFLAGQDFTPSDENILVVAHGGSLRGLIFNLVGLPVSHFWRIRLANASLSIVETVEGGALLSLLNDVSHLDGLVKGIDPAAG